MVLLVAGQVAVALLFGRLSVGAGAEIGDARAVLALAGAFALAASFTMQLEFRRHRCTFTLTEVVLSAGLFLVGPVGLGIAAALGEAVPQAVQRVGWLKGLFNTSNRLVSATIAGLAFHAIGLTSSTDSSAWAAALVAVLCFAAIDIASTASVLAIAEGAPFHEVFAQSLPAAALTTLAAAPLGPIGLGLYQHGVAGPLLLVPLIVAVALNSRYATAQRDEHLRFERLFEASSRTARLVAFDEALRALAKEACDLGTGLAAACCAKDQSGTWVGVVVDDHGSRNAPATLVEGVVSLGSGSDARELDLADEWEELRRVAPEAESVLFASSADGPIPIVLTVFRDGRTDAGAAERVPTLGAFAHTASLMAANARLFEEREKALAYQLELNRQKDDFVASVSHELRTPLAVMLGSMGTIERLDARLTDEQRTQLVDTAIEQGGRLQRLIDELLLVAAAEHSTSKVVQRELEIPSLLGKVRRDTERMTGGRLSLRVETGLDNVVTDPMKLQQVLTNLVENAGKYAPEGPIELAVRQYGAELHFTVTDHGPGIAAEDRERVFERFVQLDQSSTRRQGGTGLGLYLCRQLAELLGGSLSLDAAPGGGCRFTLVLPAGEVTETVGERPGGPSTASRPATGTRFEGIRARPSGARVPPPGLHPAGPSQRLAV